MNKLMTNYSTNANKSNRLISNRLFLAQSVVFAVLLVNAIRANLIPNIFILALAMIIPLFLNPMEIAAYIVGFSMMGTGIQIAYIALSCLISLLLKSQKKIRAVPLVSILIFICFELVHLVMSPSDDIIEFLRYAIVYALLFYIMFMDYDVPDKIRVVDSYIYGTIVSVLHIFIESVKVFNGDLSRFIDGSFRFGYSQQIGVDLTMAADPNLVGQSCSFVIVFCLALIMLGYKNKRYYLSMFVALLVGTLTISKTFLISVLLIVAFMILFVGSWTSYKMIGRRILILALVLLGCFIVIKVNPSYIENIFSRVDESDITTGRVANALIYFEYLMNEAHQLFFGVGMQNVGEKIGFTGSPHAAIIEAIVCWGVIGTLVILALIVKSILQHTSAVKPRILNYVPLFVFAILVQSTQLFRLRDRVFALIVVIVLTGIPQKGENLNECQEKRVIGN